MNYRHLSPRQRPNYPKATDAIYEKREAQAREKQMRMQLRKRKRK